MTQANGPFHSPYQGQNSLGPRFQIPSSVTATLFVGHKLWKNAVVFVNPEESMGSGLSHTEGLAGFPSGEIYRVSDPDPMINLSRLFVQQDFDLGGGKERIEDDQNQFPGVKDVKRVTLVAGKFSLNDYLDNNAYSHDPRTQFLNWCLMDNCAWDYAADTRGYTWGFYQELKLESWSFRFAVAEEPAIANQEDMDGDLAHANSENLEVEHRYQILEHPGAARFLMYMNHAHMGSYSQSIAQAAASRTPPSITSSEIYRTKYGLGLNMEQEATHDLGLFMRLGWDDGATETWAFTEVDRAFSIGATLKGACWHRSQDSVGLALMINGLSPEHAEYLALGGSGFMLGDGSLSYAPEEIVETYYLYKPIPQVGISGDFQFAKNPGYNSDRGPVPIYSVRMHFEI